MQKKTWFIVASLIVMSLTLIGARPIKAPQVEFSKDIATQRQQYRNRYVKFETIIDALDITEGMTIIDIGCGAGYASFLFAEKLGGTGQVFATDVDEDVIRYMADETKKRGLANLHPVLVQKEGLDDFYGRHRYDIVLMAYIYHHIKNPIEYFGKLRNFLKPGARVVFVLYNQASLFVVDDFMDINSLRTVLGSAAEKNPFLQHLSHSTRQLLQEKNNREALVHGLVADFNRMLVDPQLYKAFYGMARKPSLREDNLTVLNVRTREFANWLIMTLKEEGAFEKPVDQIDAKTMRSVIKLNRLFFEELLGKYLVNGGMGAYLPTGDIIRNTNKYTMLRELKSAGYKVVDEVYISPYFDSVIMTPISP
ncbi:class I SAM-dependent methyltransferase [Thermodesulfobacteriota bacterium]